MAKKLLPKYSFMFHVSKIIQFYVQNCPPSTCNSCMTALMILIAIMPTDIYNMSVLIYFYLIYKTNSNTFPIKRKIICRFFSHFVHLSR